MIVKKRISILLLAAFCIQFIPANIHAAEIGFVNTCEVASENQVRSTDSIVYKYRMNNGVLQYRRWNETKKCWVDSKCINMT